MKICDNCWKERICSCSITDSCPYWESTDKDVSTAKEN